jgi:hypothetical protein
VEEQRNSLTRSGKRRFWLIVAIVGGSVVTAVCLACIVLRDSVSDGPDPMATVDADTQFRLQQRRPGEPWTERPFPRDQAIALLQAISTARRWQMSRFEQIFGPSHRSEPSLCVVLIWYKGAGNRADREQKAVEICRGNGIVGYRNTLYQLSKEGREVLDRLLPTNSYRVPDQ